MGGKVGNQKYTLTLGENVSKLTLRPGREYEITPKKGVVPEWSFLSPGIGEVIEVQRERSTLAVLCA